MLDKMINLNAAGRAHGILEDTDGMAAWLDGHKISALEWFVYSKVKTGELTPNNLMGIENVMARAAAMAELDAWDSVEKEAEVVHKSARGTLLAVSWLSQRILKVVCPSTSKVYFLGVPATVTTVEEAQAFVNQIEGDFDVES